MGGVPLQIVHQRFEPCRPAEVLQTGAGVDDLRLAVVVVQDGEKEVDFHGRLVARGGRSHTGRQECQHHGEDRHQYPRRTSAPRSLLSHTDLPSAPQMALMGWKGAPGPAWYDMSTSGEAPGPKVMPLLANSALPTSLAKSAPRCVGARGRPVS